MKDTNSITIARLREGIWNKAKKTKKKFWKVIESWVSFHLFIFNPFSPGNMIMMWFVKFLLKNPQKKSIKMKENKQANQ